MNMLISNWVLFLLRTILQFTVVEVQLNLHLYHTDRTTSNGLYYDCILKEEGTLVPGIDPSLSDNPYIQLLSYCVRPFLQQLNASLQKEIFFVHGVPTRFEILRANNITSQDLLLFNAPIDIAEKYQAFVEGSNSSLAAELFYNCSAQWFGEFCEYKFDFNSKERQGNFRTNHKSCYIFLDCDLGSTSLCLDWREICDGKIDCFNNGVDELGCDELDLSECADNEFRCNNGFCIPLEFFNDNPKNPDCMDRSDEKVLKPLATLEGKDCRVDRNILCEDTKCRSEIFTSCGNGECSRIGCSNMHHEEVRKRRVSHSANLHLPTDCWISLLCLTNEYVYHSDSLEEICMNETEVEKMYQENCPASFKFPAYPALLHHIYYVYVNHSIDRDIFYPFTILPHYVCYDEELCEWLPATVRINGSSCQLYSELPLEPENRPYVLDLRLSKFFLRCSTTPTKFKECPKFKPFRCANSTKCISFNRLLDGFVDCFLGDDEKITNSCLLADAKYRFACETAHICVPIHVVTRGKVDCENIDGFSFMNERKKLKLHELTFQLLCDGYIDNEMIDGLNDTDEMNCDYWPCNNIYTRCDSGGIINCKNGMDEAVCTYNPCRPNALPCISPFNYSLACLPLEFINDGRMDCVSGYDEHDRSRHPSQLLIANFRCFNSTKYVKDINVCRDDTAQCPSTDDEGSWCRNILQWWRWILNSLRANVTELQKSSLSNLYLKIGRYRTKNVQFSLRNHNDFPLIKTDRHQSSYNLFYNLPVDRLRGSNQLLIQQKKQLIVVTDHCNKGFPIFTVNSNNKTTQVCLCPPAYFGNFCQYQNQRISLTLQFRAFEWRKIYTFVVILFDEENNIHSVEQFEFVPVRDCKNKYNMYLFYLTQPKYKTTSYYVRIDTYDKVTMNYYNSVLFPIRYTFLPVHRLSFRVDVPIPEFLFEEKYCPLKCMHGQCKYYSNSNKSFCHCIDGYSGLLCTNKMTCDCAPGSLCIAVIRNQSICICPMEKFGRRCYLNLLSCQSKTCIPPSQCIPVNENINQTKHYCLCSDDRVGPRCQNNATKLEFLLDEAKSIPPSIFVHLIYVTKETLKSDDRIPAVPPLQVTTVAKIKFGQTSTFIYYSGEFNIIFVQFDGNYYLLLLRKQPISVNMISIKLFPQLRCAPINELFDSNIQVLPKWHRAKYYHIPCQNDSKLACFYDKESFMCICDNDRHANCFTFDQSPASDCSGYNYCLNDGKCYLDNTTCPTASLCYCQKCYFGSRCQFTTTGFGLSLDDILGYSIQPNIPFAGQPVAVKISAAFTVVMFTVAIVNSILSIITFQTQGSLQIGCGHYLLGSSIASLTTMIIFSLKFLTLLLSQMAIITNRSFLMFNCISLNFLLKSLSAIGDWLNACVAIERTVTVQLGINFNKNKSKSVARILICAIYLLSFASFVHVPIRQFLLDDVDEERIWCSLRYSSSLRKFASFMNAFHFLVPLAINFISIIYLVILIARQKSRSRHESYREHLWKQLRENKHRLISSFGLIIIGMPRFIISVLSTCMESSQTLWLYLTGYFISFIPPLLVFVLFVMPSKFYRREFENATVRIRRRFRFGICHR